MRVEGDPLTFRRLKNGFLLNYCSSIIKGLPKWAQQLEREDEKKKAENEQLDGDNEQAELNDDYSKELNAHFAKENMGGFNTGTAVKN